MKKYILDIATIFLVGMSIVGTSWKAIDRPQTQQDTIKNIAADSLYNQYILNIYHEIHLDSAGLNEQVFEKALTGFYNMKYSGLLHAKSILTIADFDQESTKKRLYIIDLASKKLVLNTWVAHGQNSGGDKPSSFSNNINSNQSSLGFYLTGEIYSGKHGRSIKLDGMDQGFNSNARERSIVVHGASYVSQKSIDQLGRLGRSQGCPAVPAKLADQVINTISDRTVLFINNSDQQYNSSFLNETLAASVILNQEQILAAQMD
ncbi:murein L,D-transpeptidase catalytic domain family protein [Pedobacter sp. MR2016-19]|uniref:L,D-transpeptidase-like protein n=1 Tax=Pedobacter alluvionis TaxID=475253 RepID=A0A497YB13_9SPHI|nr:MULTISPECIES: murein L,D-transpeptidase catalytic domain family protein [Pedobacter]MBE5321437.1 murein L,D-transpeptidase catalytic domain family protein [Pedobacter sp. MR2016-19]RLJ80753.1 L,D-transpeptidase-like protein [Pedobacter alluvionis]TFB32000.1 murein L,D-transpeptidase catalytic domain family protein [Pedobacter alluvionis]